MSSKNLNSLLFLPLFHRFSGFACSLAQPVTRANVVARLTTPREHREHREHRNPFPFTFSSLPCLLYILFRATLLPRSLPSSPPELRARANGHVSEKAPTTATRAPHAIDPPDKSKSRVKHRVVPPTGAGAAGGASCTAMASDARQRLKSRLHIMRRSPWTFPSFARGIGTWGGSRHL